MYGHVIHKRKHHNLHVLIISTIIYGHMGSIHSGYLHGCQPLGYGPIFHSLKDHGQIE